AAAISKLRSQLILSLGIDGVAAYKLTPNIELFCLADAILSFPRIQKAIPAARWARLRMTFLQQRLLSEAAPTLQESIYEELQSLDDTLTQGEGQSNDWHIAYILERAAIHTYYGFDRRARADLDEATKDRKFQFSLTGLLGKRTKYQEKDFSQLVVLAKSAGSGSDDADGKAGTEINGTKNSEDASSAGETAAQPQAKPQNLDLNDDTLLEAISFSERARDSTSIRSLDAVPSELSSLDPSDQPKLESLDSIILLALASSIKNTAPEDGLTREETLPYATRVLEGGSSNWQVYTQALLVRSRIEGYRSRTVERGLLQLQALVDQVIAETSTGNAESQATSFLPKAKENESAPVTERLQYVFQLCSPTRWELEAELASRWVSLGGLRSALEIYERLEMWAEAALCWAATEREDKAKRIVRRQLYHSTTGHDETADPGEELWEGTPRDPPPADAPRLYCILGDIDKDVAMYERAWDVSNQRYARAQRSLGRHYFSEKEYVKSIDAYAKSLKVNQLNQSSWFAMGCGLLELGQFERAAQAFSRTVQLDDQDAEAWSNLAAALLNLEPEAPMSQDPLDEPSDNTEPQTNEALSDADYIKSRNDLRHDALNALKRAATLKFTNS
ncbi:hypothetical protein LTS18_011030, partial [Coniosporium uncinatum]